MLIWQPDHPLNPNLGLLAWDQFAKVSARLVWTIRGKAVGVKLVKLIKI